MPSDLHAVLLSLFLFERKLDECLKPKDPFSRSMILQNLIQVIGEIRQSPFTFGESNASNSLISNIDEMIGVERPIEKLICFLWENVLNESPPIQFQNESIPTTVLILNVSEEEDSNSTIRHIRDLLNQKLQSRNVKFGGVPSPNFFAEN